MPTWGGPREAVACDLCGRDDAEHLVTKNTFPVVRCRHCGLVYVSPRLAVLSSIYERETYKAHQAERGDDEDWTPRARARLGLLERHARKGKLLDVGCSTGWFLSVAADAGWQATGIDVSRSAVEQDRSRGLDAKVGTIESVELPTHSFDAITMFDSIEHMPSPMRALARARELLADGGVLFVTTPNVDGLLPKVTWRLFGKRFGEWDHPGPPGHVYQFSDRTLRTALEKSGFEVIHDGTEAIDLTYSVGALEDVLVDVVKHRGRRRDDDAEVSEPTGADDASHDAPHRHPDPKVRMMRLAMRKVMRGAAWAMTAAIAGPAPLVGRGDSLVTLARRA